jgi:hypothetical protein
LEFGHQFWVRHRREAEDILCEAGAAILHLPDFYGPQVHISTLQNALNEAASGKPSTGSARRMYNANTSMSPMPCASPPLSALTPRPSACIGACPAAVRSAGRQVADIAGRHLGRPVKLRSVGLTTLRIVGLFNKDLRGLLQVAPDYMKPVRYSAHKLQGLLGPPQMTSYDVGIGQTLAWIVSGR